MGLAWACHLPPGSSQPQGGLAPSEATQASRPAACPGGSPRPDARAGRALGLSGRVALSAPGSLGPLRLQRHRVSCSQSWTGPALLPRTGPGLSGLPWPGSPQTGRRVLQPGLWRVAGTSGDGTGHPVQAQQPTLAGGLEALLCFCGRRRLVRLAPAPTLSPRLLAGLGLHCLPALSSPRLSGPCGEERGTLRLPPSHFLPGPRAAGPASPPDPPPGPADDSASLPGAQRVAGAQEP